MSRPAAASSCAGVGGARPGGVAHGPRTERDYTRKINKNVRAKALATVLSQKFADGKVLFVDTLSFEKPKTKDARAFISALSTVKGAEDLRTKRTNAALIVLQGRAEDAELSFRNMGNTHVVAAKDVNPVDVLTYKYVVVAKPDETLKALEARVSTKTARRAAAVKA